MSRGRWQALPRWMIAADGSLTMTFSIRGQKHARHAAAAPAGAPRQTNGLGATETRTPRTCFAARRDRSPSAKRRSSRAATGLLVSENTGPRLSWSVTGSCLPRSLGSDVRSGSLAPSLCVRCPHTCRMVNACRSDGFASKETDEHRACRQEEPVRQFKYRQYPRDRRRAGCPAPTRQSRPYFDECRRSRKELSIPSANMKAFHRAPLGQPARNHGIGFRDIDERERAQDIFATIIADLRPTQRTGAVKINRRSARLGLHVYLLCIGASWRHLRRMS